MTWRAYIVLAGLVLIGIGCDNRPSAPPGYSESDPHNASSATRPTTQALLSAPYKRLSLSPLPLTVNAPPSWTVKSMADDLYFLQGVTPAGEVQIQLAERMSQSSEKLERLFKAARRDASAHPADSRVEIRQLGELRVFDVQRVVKHDATTVPPVEPPAPALPGKLVDWSVTYFAPRGSNFAAYELHFFSLSTEQFEADKDFLQKILDSVTAEDAGLGVTPDVPR